VVGMEFVRATEAGALSAYKWMGKGDKESADFAACDAIRGMFDTVDVSGTVTIGEGIKDEAPGIFKSEKLGLWTKGSLHMAIALKLGKRVQDLTVVILDRPRHERVIHDIRRAGAAIRLISDGDIAAAIAPSMPGSGVDVYMGTGGSPEAVLAAAGIKCLGGEILAQMWPRDD